MKYGYANNNHIAVKPLTKIALKILYFCEQSAMMYSGGIVMTKVSIKVISVILCAVMVVGCCFVGCEDDNINDVTLTQLLEALKVEYPDAHIYNGILYDSNGEMDVNGGTFILLTDSENSGMSVGRFFGYDNNPDEYSVSKSQDSVNIYQIKTKEDCKKILNTIMPLY